MTSLFTEKVIGIVGSEGAKFTPETEEKAKKLIRELLTAEYVTGVSSGACHLGGVDVWAEEIGKELKLGLYIFPPKKLRWEDGYKPRNMEIVRASDEIHCITLKELPENYKGMRFDFCYHCNTNDHVKSGGCWTAKQAQKQGKKALWHIL